MFTKLQIYIENKMIFLSYFENPCVILQWERWVGRDEKQCSALSQCILHYRLELNLNS